MDFNVEPSLAHQASIVIVSSMWCREFKEQLFSIKTYPNGKYDRKWLQERSNNIVMCLEGLTIPKTIKHHLLNIFLPIGQQIFTYLESHEILNYTFLQLSELIVWSHQGTIDYKATADKLLKNNNLCTLDRFAIACKNCVYKEILELWPKVRVHYDYHEPIHFLRDMEIVFWTYHLKNDIRKLMQFMEYSGGCGMEFASCVVVESENHVFAKYFIEQLEPHKSAQVIKNLYNGLILRNPDSNILLAVCFLSHLSEHDQMEIFMKDPEKSLLILTSWPFQNHFLKLANKLWNSLTPIGFYCIVEELAGKVSEYHWGQMYENIFIEFWNEAPLIHKNYVIDKCIKSPFLCRIFLLDNIDSIITFLFSQMSPKNKLELLFGFNGNQIIGCLLSSNLWTLLKLFIENCVSTRDDIDTLNKTFPDHVQSFHVMIDKDKLNEFYKYLKSVSERLN